MESKQAMVFLQEEMPHILQYGGRVPLWETCNTMRAYSKHENATLIEQVAEWKDFAQQATYAVERCRKRNVKLIEQNRKLRTKLSELYEAYGSAVDITPELLVNTLHRRCYEASDVVEYDL
jgi:hypothetical protein